MRNRPRIEEVLAELRIPLTEEQRGRLVEAYGAFESRRNQIWTEAKRSGAEGGEATDWDLVTTETRRAIQREFTERISSFIPGADAERISASLNPGGK